MSPETKKFVDETQRMVIESFKSDVSPLAPPSAAAPLRLLCRADESLVREKLGEGGVRAKRLAEQLNADHPDMDIVLDHETASALSVAGQAVAGGDAPADFKFNLRVPAARLLADPAERLRRREAKTQVRAVRVNRILGNSQFAENHYFSRPSCFRRFARGSSFRDNERATLEERRSFFAGRKMGDMAGVFMGHIRSLESSAGTVCGFSRVRPDEAAVILARMHGFVWQPMAGILVPGGFFDPAAKEVQRDPRKLVVLGTKFSPTNSTSYIYEARIYPLHCFPVERPAEAQQAVQATESLRELGGNPFFDHFWVVVPSVQLKSELQMASLAPGESPTEVTPAKVDAALVLSGQVCPVILGERDGCCYFVSMWS